MRRRSLLIGTAGGIATTTAGCLRFGSSEAGTPTGDPGGRVFLEAGSMTVEDPPGEVQGKLQAVVRGVSGEAEATYDDGTGLFTVTGPGTAIFDLADDSLRSLSFTVDGEEGVDVLRGGTLVEENTTSFDRRFDGSGTPTRTPMSTDRTAATTTDAPDSTPTETATGTPTASSVGTTRSSDVQPIFAYRFEDGFTDSANGIDPKPAASAVDLVSGRGGTVLELGGDGSGDDGGYVDVSHDDIGQYISPGDSLTLAMWVRPRNNSGWEILAGGPGMGMGMRRGRIRCAWYSPATNDFLFSADADVSEALPNGEWHHLVGVLEADRLGRLYVDGEEIAVDTFDGEHGYTEAKYPEMRIGFHGRADDGAYDSHFGGRLDDIRLYRGAMSADEVSSLYRGTR